MTLDVPEADRATDVRLGEVLGEPRLRAPERRAEDAPEQPEVPEPVGSPLLTALAASLSSFGAGLASASLFSGWLPLLLAFASAALGGAVVAWSYRVRRTTMVQFAVVPLAVAAAALAAVPASGGSASLPSLIGDALRAGGIAQPPVAFDPGWRFLLVVAVTLLSAASASMAISLGRARLAVFLPIPVTCGAALIQTVQVWPVLGSLVLIVAALAVAFGVELERDGTATGGFELRRFVKGAGALLVLLGLLAGVTRLGFLFPDARDDRVIPPTRPRPAPPEPDRELFIVTADRQLPWRTGVLDVYDGRAWLTPPLDPRRFLEVDGAGRWPARKVLGAPAATIRAGSTDPGAPDTVTATFSMSGMRGHTLPAAANPVVVERDELTVEYDPRTQTLRLPTTSVSRGLTYTVRAPIPPRGADLAEAGPPPVDLAPFLEVPEPPAGVARLLEEAPRGNGFDRLQFVRTRFYEKAVAKGAGQPLDVPPERVEDLLAGTPGNPFEITAAETLLARWAGVPARIGYGYLGGDVEDGRASIRPRHAAMWLEAYFESYGWVPILGTPPQAQSSLRSADKNPSAAVRPSENLTLSAYVPVRIESLRLLYLLVQYWVGRVFTYAVPLALALWLYPGVVKVVRRARRRRWAQGDLADRIRVAYAEFRDTAGDFNIGRGSLTPLEFLDVVEPDVQHTELAWLVTRSLWGDLGRDLEAGDAETAEALSRSLVTRIRSVQPAVNWLVAFASRRSLRVPYSREVPNLWWPDRGEARRARGKAIWLPRSRPKLMLGALLVVAALVAMIVASGFDDDAIDLAAGPSAPLPKRAVPAKIRDVEFRREATTEAAYREVGDQALVGTTRVFSLHAGEAVVGALHLAAFKAPLVDRQPEVRAGLLEALGGDQFELRRIGGEPMYVQRTPELQLFLWFPPKGAYYELFVAQSDFEEAGLLFADVLAYQQGIGARTFVPRNDSRRGFDG